MSHELAASSSLVAIKLSNIKVFFEAHGMFNYNLDIILCSKVGKSGRRERGGSPSPSA